MVPVTGYTVNVLRTGPTQDADLVNAWGLSRGATSPWWVADNGTDVATLYLADGTKLTVPRVPIPEGAPTGTVFNGVSTDFNGDNFLFDGEAGVIFGWRGALGVTHDAEVLNDQFKGDAVFKGLAIGTVGSTQYLYATDFHNRRIDVFASSAPFVAQTWTGAFHDPELPAGYAPFNVQNLNSTRLRHLREDATGQRRRARGARPRIRRRLRDRRHVPRARRDPWPVERAVGSRLGAVELRSLQRRPPLSATSATARSMPTVGRATIGDPTASCSARTGGRS